MSPTSNSSPVGEVEFEPEFAVSVVGMERMPMMRSFVADLARYGEDLGLLGPLELPRLWSRHIVNCALVAPLLGSGRVGDIGSGAGLPGLVLAIARPDIHLVLIEPMERRVDWLGHEVARLGLTNVSIVRSRAEETRLDTPLDQVTARAVTALSKLIPATAPLLKKGGEMLFLKGERVAAELEAAAGAIRKARLRDIEVLTLGTGITPEVTRVFRATVD